ncbi:hypothetical protein AXF42_Ash014223 [Apostasia shenzhenica]|uniref:Uncharacterized protein n=1 Tax=Apostasia shenzhenica TaxID=1088818 RepID=A0A2I0A1A3_9ASPA|nr:hypothetical protein AXF42_Ash014223 [Apostasia shenzhenica]
MPHRAYVLIFIFWALLAIITPTLVLWSASAKPNFLLNKKENRGILARRMMASGKKANRRNITGEGGIAPAPPPIMTARVNGAMGC